MANHSWSWAVLILVIMAAVAEGCSSSNEYDEYRVVRKSDAGGKQINVAIDDDARLYCQTNYKWKRCIWKPPRNGVRQLRCDFKKGPGNMVSCPSFPEIHFDKMASAEHEHKCAIVVQNIQAHHEGQWKCEFELDLPEDEMPEEPVIIKERVKVLARKARAYRYF